MQPQNRVFEKLIEPAQNDPIVQRTARKRQADGIGISIDRLCMMFPGQESIRNVSLLRNENQSKLSKKRVGAS